LGPGTAPLLDEPHSGLGVGISDITYTPADVFDDPLMYWPEVQPIVRMVYSTVWRREKAGKFPPHVMHGGRAAWFRSQIRGHMESLRNTARVSPATPK
jgi:predicted DNA-binding transcriptional regulator AlpA